MTTEHQDTAAEKAATEGAPKTPSTPAKKPARKPAKKAGRKAVRRPADAAAPKKETSAPAAPQTPEVPGEASRSVPHEEPHKAPVEKRAVAPSETASETSSQKTSAPADVPTDVSAPVAGEMSANAGDPVPQAPELAIPPLDPTVPPPGGEKPIALNPFAPPGAKGPIDDEPIEANFQRAILDSSRVINDNYPALCELMKNDRTQSPVYVPAAPQHRPSGEAGAATPKASASETVSKAKPARKAGKAKKTAKAAPTPASAPLSPVGSEGPSEKKTGGKTAAGPSPKEAPKTASKAAPRLRFRVEDAPVSEEKKPKATKGPKPPLTNLFALPEADAEVLTAEEPVAAETSVTETPLPEAPLSTDAPLDDAHPTDDVPEAERLLGRRAALPRQSEARDAEGETLLSRPRVADVPMGRIARRGLEHSIERRAREEGRPVPKTAGEERAARILRAPHDVRPEDPHSLESIRRAMRAEEEVDAVLNEILESSRSIEEANAKMNKLLAELTACDPVQAPDGTTHYKIRDPEAFRRSILFSKLLLLPDLRTGPTWMRSVIRARHEAGCALRLTEAFTLELDRDALPDDSPLRLDDSGAFVERTTETPPPPDPAVTHLLMRGDTRRADRPQGASSEAARGASSDVSNAPSDPSGRSAVRTAPLGVVPREALIRTPWDAGVQLLKVSVFLGVAFVGGLLGGRTALSDPGLLHTDRLAFVDLTSVAKSGFPDAEGFPEAFRAVLNKISEERGLVLVAKNFLLTGPAPETRDRDLTVEVITGLIDRLGMPGERGMRVPTWDLPKEVERVLMPSSTEAANERVGKSGAIDDPVARGRGTDALGVPYLKPLPEDASRTLFATEHAARASRLSALEAEKSAREATRAAEDLRREIERRKADRTFRDTAQERLEAP